MNIQSNQSNKMVTGKRKILVIGSLPPPHNGMSVVFDQLVRSKLSRQFKLIVLNISDHRALGNVGKFDIVNIFLALYHGLMFLWYLARYRPDLVYLPVAQGSLGYLRDSLFLIPCRVFAVPVTIHLHGSEFYEFYDSRSWLMKCLIRFTLEKINCAIVLGESLRGVFDGLISSDRIVVVPNGVRASNLITVKRNDKNERVQITFLGSLKPRKGYLELIHAIPRILDQVPDARFVFAGEVCHKDSFEEAMAFLDVNQLTKTVEFPGVVSGTAKKDLFNCTDIFCFPSIRPEGQPLVILEAMSNSIPIVATVQGAIPDMVVDGITGYLIHSEYCQEELVSRLVTLASDHGLRKTMGNAALRRFEEEFTLALWEDRMIDTLTKCY